MQCFLLAKGCVKIIPKTKSVIKENVIIKLGVKSYEVDRKAIGEGDFLYYSVAQVRRYG